jgi:1-acyl-sn-glycerol-3-phosphate acyltransferase
MAGIGSGRVATDEAAVLDAVGDVAEELRGGVAVPVVRLDSRLDAELGLDSLSLVELRTRLESVFDVELPDRILAVGVTPADWVDAVRRAHGRVRAPAAVRRTARPGGDGAHEGGADGEGPPAHAATLVEALEWHAVTHPDRVHITIIHADDPDDDPDGNGEPAPPDGAVAPGSPETAITYGDLRSAALAVAGGLGESGIVRGDAVAVMLPTGRQYFEAFVGILFAGGVPIPIYPPARPAAIEDHLRRQARILANAQATLLVADPQTFRVARFLRPHVPTLRAVRTVADLLGGPITPAPVVGGPERTALVQYTSGSTGNPKGVVLTNDQILANIRAMGAAAGVTTADVFVSWLPLYHDMGLIGAWMAAMYFGYPLVLMPPLAFLARPSRWLRAISDYGGTLSASPNFGYELCCRHTTEAELEGVDLSSWRMALNGAEPVSPETIRRFTDRFVPSGFRPEAMAPVYGMAEVGVGLSFPPPGRVPVVDSVDRATFARTGRAAPATGDGAAMRFVSCGRPLPGYGVRVVGPGGELGERREGRIECRGPSATSGYLRDEADTRALRHGDWLDTGDLGYLADGELYVTGRAKDIVIRAGRNLHPEEIEEAVGDIPGVRKGCVAAFATVDREFGTERLVILAESRLTDARELDGLRAAVNSTTVDLLGTPPDDVVFAPPGTVLKTSSGKIRRAATRQRYEAAEVGQAIRPPWWQLTRFAVSGARARVRGVGGAVARWSFAAYAWSVLIALGIPTWILVAVLPTVGRRWWAVRGAGRAVGRLTGTSVRVAGERLEGTGPKVLVANHPSFIDGLVVGLCAKEPLCFVAGDEFASQRIAGPFLRRLGCAFVHRADPERMASDVTALSSIAAEGRSLVFFPEGSLDRSAGIRPFHLGAFTVATGAGVPVVPLGIRGSRDVVRPGEKLPRRGEVEVVVGSPIAPEGSGWEATLRQREESRAAVCTLSGEPATM